MDIFLALAMLFLITINDLFGVYYLIGILLPVNIFLLFNKSYLDEIELRKRFCADPMLMIAGGFIDEGILQYFESRQDLKAEYNKLICFIAEASKVIDCRVRGSPIQGYKISPMVKRRDKIRKSNKKSKKKTSSSGSRSPGFDSSLSSLGQGIILGTAYETEMKFIVESKYT